MAFSKILIAGAVALSLVACTDAGSPSLKAAPGQSVDQIARSLTQTRAIAAFLGTACRAQGIALREPNVTLALSRDVTNLKKQGYSGPALEAAFRRAGRDKALVQSAITYLESRGAKKGNVASVCAVGLREIEAQTAVGRLLKKV